MSRPISQPARYAPPSARQLLARILETPELVSAVRALPAQALGRLINHVGLEDSGDLVALASTDQLRQVFDEDLWTSAGPGGEERFDGDRFALWLEVLLEAGEELAARKLVELPLDLVTLALHRQVLVINADELAVLASCGGSAMERELALEMADSARDYTFLNKALDSCLDLELGEHLLISRRHEGWDALVAVLLALDRDHHDTLHRLLQRLSLLSAEEIEEEGGLPAALRAVERVEADVAADREDRRAAQGFVAPASAASLLALARTTSLDALRTQPRDPVTRAYFRELGRQATRAHADEQAPTPSTPGPEVAEVAGLVEVLREAQVLPDARPALTAGSGRPPPVSGPFGAAIQALLSVAPEAHAARMEELAYLANVLLAGCSGRRSLRPVEGAEAAVAVCELGFEDLLTRSRPPGRRDPGAHAAKLLAEESADRLFLIGWHRLHHEVVLPAARALQRALEARLPSLDATAVPRLRRLGRELQAAIERGKPWLARRWLDPLETAFDAPVAVALRALVEEHPTLAGALADAARPADQLQLISSAACLRSVRAFLEAL